MVGAAADVATAPLRVLTGDVGAIGDVVKAPFKLVGGALETGIGAMTLPLRLSMGLFAPAFGTVSAGLATQSALLRHQGMIPPYPMMPPMAPYGVRP
ncbi:MAG: hypothetical protein IPG45_26985 [Deltaproteobacteria bacterium]|nr:hypothetical protein [Deltaproteobacteria bacterium]